MPISHAAVLGTVAGSPYAALGPLLYESEVNPAFPGNTGVVVPAQGTIAVRALWTDLPTAQRSAAGSGGRFTSNAGINFYPLTNNAMRIWATDGTTSALIDTGTSNALSNGVWQTLLATWEANLVRVRRGASERTAAPATALNGGQAGKNLWIGTTEGNSSWNLVGDLQKVVMYDAVLDATNRAALMALLDGEGP